MIQPIPNNFVPGAFKTVCTSCGAAWLSRDVKRRSDGSTRCPLCGPNEQTLTERDRAEQAAFKALKPDPIPPHAQEAQYVSKHFDEGAILNFLAGVPVADSTESTGVRYGWPPQELVTVTSGLGHASGGQSIQSAAWCCIYLYGFLASDKRPTEWDRPAERKIRAMANWLLQHQFGSPYANSNYTSVSTVTWYGGWPRTVPLTLADADHLDANSVYSEDVGAGGLALLRASQALGEPIYLVYAKRAATCLRRMQKGGSIKVGYSTTVASGGRYHPGMWVHSMLLEDGTGGGDGSGGDPPPVGD